VKYNDLKIGDLIEFRVRGVSDEYVGLIMGVYADPFIQNAVVCEVYLSDNDYVYLGETELEWWKLLTTKEKKMNFIPYNRHLLVMPLEEEEKENESVVVLPTDYVKPASPYLLCEVLESSGDCTIRGINVEDQIIVERRMLHKVDVEGETFYLVLENYVFGRLK
jgi:hypothetical protein